MLMIFGETLSLVYGWFADDCVIYRKIMDSSDIDKLQMDLNSLEE
jgi:hypothetical protein